MPGVLRALGEQQGYRQRMSLMPQSMAQATHLVWATGGSMVPEAEMERYLTIGREQLKPENTENVSLALALYRTTLWLSGMG